MLLRFVLRRSGQHRALHSFPTRRSSDLDDVCDADFLLRAAATHHGVDSKRACPIRSEEHTSELQSRGHLVCRLLLEKKKNNGKKAPMRQPYTRAREDTTDQARETTMTTT